MRVGMYRVYFHTITEKELDGKPVEVSRTSPIMEMVVAERVDQLLAALPKPEQKEGTTTRNVIVQIDQKHKNALLAGVLVGDR